MIYWNEQGLHGAFETLWLLGPNGGAQGLQRYIHQ